MDIHYQPLDSTIRIGTLGRGVWKTKSVPDQIVLGTEVGESLGGIELGTVWPTAFTDVLNIEFRLHETVPVSLALYNMRGQKVLTRELGEMIAGEQQYKWDIGQITIPAGVYFLRMKAGGFAASVKLLSQ